MYANGTGVKQNRVNAYAWLVIAAHYFIYETALSGQKNNAAVSENKRQLLFVQQQEKEKIFEQIIEKLENLKNDMQPEDIEKTKNKVIKLSKFRKKYHSEKIKKLEFEADMENLFLPETLY